MCAETIITEQAEWNPESNIMTMLSLNTVLKWVWRAQQEGLDVIIVNPGVIIGCVPDQGSGELIKSVWWLSIIRWNNWFYLRY
jgi:hypothetical protein